MSSLKSFADDVEQRKREAYTTANAKGESTANWTLTPVSVTDPVLIVAQPIYTVPIIFVPGIMGSNLMVTQDVDKLKKGSPVWLMDSKGGAVTAWGFKNPTERQLRLNPNTTAVYPGGDVPSNVPTVTIGNATQLLQGNGWGESSARVPPANRTEIPEGRGWGEVGAMSYQSYLVWLEDALNGKGRIDGWRNLQGEPDFAKVLSDGFKFQQVKKEDIGHGADMRFPVYACGYNWLQSNAKSAERLAKRIDDVIKANNNKFFTCEKVILITHSMGGLVARHCSEMLKKSGKIAGILHGVMPATGAAVAYKRVRSGTEGSAGIVIGGTAEKVTPVFANAPGALQLLPSQHYPTGWLKLGVGRSGGFKEVTTLPTADPYAEIYEQKGKWWGLVRENLIDPAKLEGHEGWDDYLKNIRAAKEFHTDLGNQYHKNTISFFGDGRSTDNGMTWGTVRWEGRAQNAMTIVKRDSTGRATVTTQPSTADFLAMSPASDDGQGKVIALLEGSHPYDFGLSAKDSAGDGTVPVVSGNAPALAGAAAGVKASYYVNVDGEGHEGAYRVPQAQQLSLHAVLSLARTIKITS